jgi:N-acyl-D-amino-acid deacylase
MLMSAHRIDDLTKSVVAPRLSRRAALHAGGTALAASVAGIGSWTGRAIADDATPTSDSGTAPTGQSVPTLAGFDQAMTAQMSKWHLPGGQLALAKDGRLLFNRGYGLADVDQQVPVQPDSLFRIASVTKTITTVAVLTLVDAGMLTLDDQAFPLLGLPAADNATPDPRLNAITIKDLLVHAGGWDSNASFDPQYLPWSRMAAATLGLDDPAEATTIVRYMLGVPLDFDPGTKSVYSNFGFNVLGRVIERVAGQPYEDYVRDRVLTPAGIRDMRLGRTRQENRAPGEVFYYGPPDQAARESAFWGEGYVPVGYGSYYMEALDAHGGWIASAADLVRFTTAVAGQGGMALLKPETLQAMITTPRPQAAGTGAGNSAVQAGLGWDMKPVSGGVEWSHAGALEGANASWLFRGADGLTIAFIFSSLPVDYGTFFPDTGQALLAAAGAVQTWPTGDPFE